MVRTGLVTGVSAVEERVEEGGVKLGRFSSLEGQSGQVRAPDGHDE